MPKSTHKSRHILPRSPYRAVPSMAVFHLELKPVRDGRTAVTSTELTSSIWIHLCEETLRFSKLLSSTYRRLEMTNLDTPKISQVRHSPRRPTTHHIYNPLSAIFSTQLRTRYDGGYSKERQDNGSYQLSHISEKLSNQTKWNLFAINSVHNITIHEFAMRLAGQKGDNFALMSARHN